MAENEPRLDGATTPEIDLAVLVGQGTRAVIIHDDRRYMLSITKQNNLILTREDQPQKGVR